jgi:hypothetical protein
MCRSIKQLRPPHGQAVEELPGEKEYYEAALQYVRKVSGYRKPSRANSAVFEQAVQEIARTTSRLLAGLDQPGEQLHTHPQD